MFSIFSVVFVSDYFYISESSPLPVETHISSLCVLQSGLKNLREHALMELMVVSVETHQAFLQPHPRASC